MRTRHRNRRRDKHLKNDLYSASERDRNEPNPLDPFADERSPRAYGSESLDSRRYDEDPAADVGHEFFGAFDENEEDDWADDDDPAELKF